MAEVHVSSEEAPSDAPSMAPAAVANLGIGTRRTARMGSNLIDYGTINFTMHKTTENAEYVLCKAQTPKEVIVSHMMEELSLIHI